MIDDGEDIIWAEVPKTLDGLVSLQECTSRRFTFRLDDSGKLAYCRWVNYYRNIQGKRVKDDNGAYILLPAESKVVVVEYSS